MSEKHVNLTIRSLISPPLVGVPGIPTGSTRSTAHASHRSRVRKIVTMSAGHIAIVRRGAAEACGVIANRAHDIVNVSGMAVFRKEVRAGGALRCCI